MKVEVTTPSAALYGEGEVGKRQTVWMSHGDEVVRLPEGFKVVSRSVQGAIAAIEHQEKRYYGLQYHPEVADTPIFLLSFCIDGDVLTSVNYVS
jgi:GMP synthase (glutamine-hydrolysing)